MPSQTRATSFAQLELHPAVRQVLTAQGISQPTPIQAAAIPVLLDGRDVIGQARTGSGKTLAFALPLVERIDPRAAGVQALVLVPTRELAIQIRDVLAPLATARGLKHTLLYGGRGLGGEKQAVRTAQIVVGTPGRTLDHLRQNSLTLRNLKVVVLDEADEMLDRGFAPDVERILAHAPRPRQTALFSATLPEWIAAIAARHVKDPVRVEVDAETPAPPEIEHVVYDVEPEAKMGVLRALLDQRGDDPVIVFGRTKHGVKKLAQRLEALGYPTAALQGNLSQNARERVMTNFRSGAMPILLATNVAARGLDVQGVAQVINYELPESAEWFTHRTGRTGRMGRSGEAITLLTPEDGAKWRQIERALGRRLPRRAWTADVARTEDVPSRVTRSDDAIRPARSRPAVAAPTRTRPAEAAPASGPSSARLNPSRGGWRFRTRRRRPAAAA